jgi:hypothetical protein
MVLQLPSSGWQIGKLAFLKRIINTLVIRSEVWKFKKIIKSDARYSNGMPALSNYMYIYIYICLSEVVFPRFGLRQWRQWGMWGAEPPTNAGAQAPPSLLSADAWINGKTPKLRLKAAEGRHMVPVTLRLLELFFPPSSDHDKLRFECLGALNLVYIQLKNWTPNSPQIVASEGRRHVMLYAELAKEWLATHTIQSWIGWKFIPKHHLSIHCFEDQIARYGNPADSWSYRDESEIGDAVKLAEAGLHPRTLRKTLMEKYRTSNAVI